MSEQAPGTEILHLSADFPPVPTADWEAAIAKDLKGADYEKKLAWRTEEGVVVRPYYRRDALEPLGELIDLAPGQFPYTRGGGQVWAEAQEWTAPAGAIRADYLHEQGATAVQELAFALAEAVEQFAADSRAPEFVFAVGSNYFFEIAKLRSARLLWATAAAAFDAAESARTRIHVRTARGNKSVLDPYTNLLRVTTEAMSAVIGGGDSLAVEAFGFDPHLALNVQRVLREEAHLDKVADPAGGSYYVEALTEALAGEAWKLFQQVESEGGWQKAVQSGFVEKALTASREAKAKSIASRRRTLVGVNNYPNLNDEPVTIVDASGEGRLAAPFEAIRARTAAHAQQTGRYPKVLLLKRGDVKMKMARANFCLNFFGCAGFDIVESEQNADSDADLIVLCSSDPEYLSFAQEVCPSVSVPVLVAGNPKEQIEALKAAGVQGFVHVLSNAVDTLTEWQDKLGIAKQEATR
jgi:methylmalonyl-CoA mutase